MLRLTLVLTVLCNTALAAHFLREGAWLLVGVCFVSTASLWSHRAWAVLLNQLALLGGALMWVATAGQVLDRRLAEGRPYVRMLWILGAVAALSLATALLWALPRVRHAWLVHHHGSEVRPHVQE